MKFLFTENLMTRSLRPAPPKPWEFKPATEISDQVRKNKVERQVWYKNPQTKHHFYTLVEPCNPNQRVTKKDNPPRLLHGVVADFDLPIPEATVYAAVGDMNVGPAWIEQSLGGNWRLVFTFEQPIPVDTYEFCAFVLDQAVAWLKLESLPGLDRQAVVDPSRMFCNGCVWSDNTGYGAISAAEVQAFFVAAGKAFTFKAADKVEIPMDVIYAALAKKYPNLTWPSEFAPESQGPSFWVEGSTSPMSAIVKPDGMFTFSAHASKPFYSWSEILGADFVKEFETQSTAQATHGSFFDGLKYWRKIANGRFASEVKEDFAQHLTNNCRLSTKPDNQGTSPLSRAMQFIRDHQRVSGAAPLLFQPKGAVVSYQGTQFLNIADDNLIRPTDSAQEWGETGGFPFISSVLDNLFEPTTQLPIFLAWLHHFYRSAGEGKPLPGQNIFLAGGPAVGKTLTSGSIVGRLLGGSIEARDYILGEDKFGGQLFSYAVWTCDDETVADSESARTRFSAFIKKLAANQSFNYHQKFERPVMIPWMGRVVITLNLDFVSCRVLPSLDNSALDKISLFRCSDTPKIKFPDRYEIEATLKTELPNFGRYLLDMTIAPELRGDSRYGVKAFQEPSLRVRAHQTNKSAQFRELLVEHLKLHFKDNPTADIWKGSAVELHRLLTVNPLNSEILRSLRLDSMSRCLEAAERAGDLAVSSETDALGVRHWVIPKGKLF